MALLRCTDVELTCGTNGELKQACRVRSHPRRATQRGELRTAAHAPVLDSWESRCETEISPSEPTIADMLTAEYCLRAGMKLRLEVCYYYYLYPKTLALELWQKHDGIYTCKRALMRCNGMPGKCRAALLRKGVACAAQADSVKCSR